MPEKNKQYEIIIDSFGNSGEGIGHIDGYTLFVRGALPGERVRVVVTKVKKSYGYAKLLEVAEPSPDRREPACPVYSRCGGCELQHMSYEAQLRFKTEHVKDCLTRIGGVPGLLLPDELQCGQTSTAGDSDDVQSAVPEHPVRMETIGCDLTDKTGKPNPWHYRNKAQFPVGREADGRAVAGFFASRSHRIIPCENCLLQDEWINRAVSIIMEQIRRHDYGIPGNGSDILYDETTHTGWLRHIYIRRAVATGQLMVCPVVNDDISLFKGLITGSSDKNAVGLRKKEERSNIEKRRIITDIFRELKREFDGLFFVLNENRDRTNVITGENYLSLSVEPYIEDRIGDITFRIAPESFYQVNPYITEKLYRKALEYAGITGDEIVWDLYCGIGTISLFMAKKARQVIGVEVIPQAIEDAKKNVEINQINNVSFICGEADKIILNSTLPRPDVVVVDPPRRGCDEMLLRAIAEAAPSRLVYVSCDPATLARDIARLRPSGYDVQKVCVADQFWQTRHVETVVLLTGETL